MRQELVEILERNGGHVDSAWGKGKLIAEIFEAVVEEKLFCALEFTKRTAGSALCRYYRSTLCL